MSSDGQSQADVGTVVDLSGDALEDLHECIIGTDTTATCQQDDCTNDAIVIASAPCAAVCFAVCADCLPDHVEWYEREPAEREARRIAREVEASINPEVEYVR